MKMKFSYKVLLLIVALKLLYLFFGNGFDLFKTYQLSNFKGDAKTYLYAAESFVNKGSYEFTGSNDGVTEYVVRMPGMAFVLVPLLYVFSFSTAIKLFVLFQVLISALAATYLFCYLKDKIKLKLLEYALLVFLAFGSFINNYNGYLLSETLAQSLFIIIACYFLTHKEFKTDKRFVLVCLLFTWTFFLRPFMIVFLPLFVIRMVEWNAIKTGVVSFLKANTHVIALGLILGAFTGAWTLRNYVKTKAFVPMEYSIKADKITYLKECTPLLFKYIHHFDGNVYTTGSDRETSHYMWFYPDIAYVQKKFGRPDDSIFPKIVFTGGITIDTLKMIRRQVDTILKSGLNSPQRKYYFEQFKSAVERADKALMSNTSTLFHLKRKKDNLMKFVYQPVQENKTYLNISAVKKAMELMNWGLNFIFVTLFIVLSLLALFTRKVLRTYYFLLLPAIFLVCFFALYFDVKEERELFCYYPAFLLTGYEMIRLLHEKWKNGKSPA